MKIPESFHVNIPTNQSELLDQFHIGKKIAFINEDNEIDEGRINTYTENSNGKVDGFEVNDQIVPLDKLVSMARYS